MSPSLNSVLKKTSRSFYLSLRATPPRIRAALSLGYLFCRAADTIADTDAVPVNQRADSLETFRSLLARFPVPLEELKIFIDQLHNYGALNKGAEGALLAALPDAIDALGRQTKTEQALIQEVVANVIQGMTMDLALFGDTPETARAFENKKTLENYLLYIGGEPGHFWTRLCLAAYPDLKIRNRDQWVRDGVRFGTGLQMVNILRDLPSDLARGRCYVPSDLLKDHGLAVNDLVTRSDPERFSTLYHALIDDALERLEHGMAYLLAIEKTSPRLRAPVWWPLAIGLKTLAKLRLANDILNPKKRVKVSRGEVFKTIGCSIGLLWSNAMMKRAYRTLRRKAS